MPTLLQINTVINSGSTGHIAEELGNIAIKNGWKSYIAYGRNPRPSNSESIKIGSKLGIYAHVFLTRFFDLHGFGSYFATKKLIKRIKEIKPNVIHLHNIHGYYLNIKVLFDYLKTIDTPVIWTLHDCWSFTGHCSHYTAVNCSKWKDLCCSCPQKKQYPISHFDNSKSNYLRKQELFTGVKNLTIVTPSEWLSRQVKMSFLSKYSVKIINNGIDLDIFFPRNDNFSEEKKIILGVASVWTERKGLKDFYKLAEILPDEYKIVLIGLNESQIEKLPEKIHGIRRTESAQQLAEWYSKSFVFFNPTYEETFPTTNIEALACGTPVITYNVGGSPEILDENTGFIIQIGDVESVKDCLKEIKDKGRESYSAKCIYRVKNNFDKEISNKMYLTVYNTSRKK